MQGKLSKARTLPDNFVLFHFMASGNSPVVANPWLASHMWLFGRFHAAPRDA